jgi:hypothetical protein
MLFVIKVSLKDRNLSTKARTKDELAEHNRVEATERL